MEMLPPAIAVPSEDMDDDDQSVTSAAFGIESSATSFTEHSGALHAAAPRHMLLELDDDAGDLQSVDGATTIAYDSGGETDDYEGDGGRGGSEDGEGSSDDEEDDEDWSPRGPERRGGGGSATGVARDGGALTKTSSRFWGVSWNRHSKKWQAQYNDANGKMRYIGYFDDEEEAARAVNKAIRDAGLGDKRRMNAVEATGALVPRVTRYTSKPCDRSAVVAPDPARAPTATTSKFWGVTWNKSARRWRAQYTDANGKQRCIGYFDDDESAARAYNAAIRRAGLERRRKTNPVVDGQLVPRERKTTKKRRRDEPAAAPSPRARRR